MSRPVGVAPLQVPSGRHRAGAITSGALLFGALAVQPALLWAAGAGGHGEHHAPSIGDLLFPAINFSIYLAIVVIYIIPAIRQYLSQRHEQILASVNAAKEELAEAERQAADARARLAKIDAECTELHDDVVAAATRQGDDRRSDAQATGERRLKDAALLAEQERRRAFGNVRSEIAALAATLAEERVRKSLGPEDQRSFVQDFLREAAQQ